MAKIGRTPELSRVRKRWVKENEVKKPSYIIIETFEKQRTSRVFVDEGIAAKIMEFVENSKLLRKNK
jgi:hypothetical protein